MKKTFSHILALAAFFFVAGVCRAHFAVVLPSADVVESGDDSVIRLRLQFMHPFDFEFMDLERPERFGLLAGGKVHDLIDSLEPGKEKGHRTWASRYRIEMPGDHVFFMVPRPYWEPAEETYIQHFTKVVVGAYGLEKGWRNPIGLKTEIVPLTRPYGLWKGNLFCGQVLLDGKPSPWTTVEVEYYNENGSLRAPSPVFATQTLVTDGDGCFCYAMPKAGWWGFAGLNTISHAMKREGKPVDLELGAVIWVHASRIE